MTNKKKLTIGVAVASLIIVTGIIARVLIENRDSKIIATDIESYIETLLDKESDRQADKDEKNESGFLPHMKLNTAADEITELIFNCTQIQIIKSDKQTCVLSVTSPDCAMIFNSILESSDEWDKTDFASSKAYVLERFRKELKDPSLPVMARRVELEVVKNGGQYEIVETEEFLDALYGGLISYYNELSEKVEIYKEGN